MVVVCRLVAGIADTTHTHVSLAKGLLLYDSPKAPRPLAHRLSSNDLLDGNDVGHGGLMSTSDYVGGDSSDGVYSSASSLDYLLTLTDVNLYLSAYSHRVSDSISV